MKFFAAGGVHEHGRNCFFVEDGVNYIVDCGIMRGSDKPYPHLTPKQIASAKYLFLTHSHEDHIGAFRRLVQEGFCGTAVASSQTLQAIMPYPKTFALPQAHGYAKFEEISLDYGRSGHCIGSHWYAVQTAGGRAFFSGDYCENSCFNVDKVSGQTADLAVLDCAFGNLKYDRHAQEEAILSFATEALKTGDLLLPVPINGRWVDLMVLLSGLKRSFSVDRKLVVFFSQLEHKHDWISQDICKVIESQLAASIDTNQHCVRLSADAQLATEEGRRLAHNVVAAGGNILLTGHTDHGSEAERLLSVGLAKAIAYNAHSCIADDAVLISRNSFKQVVYNHCKDI